MGGSGNGSGECTISAACTVRPKDGAIAIGVEDRIAWDSVANLTDVGGNRGSAVARIRILDSKYSGVGSTQGSTCNAIL